MRKTSSLKSFWPSERDWGCGPQQLLHCSSPVPSACYAVKRSCSGILQLPRLSCRSSTQPDQENFIIKAPTKVTFCLGASEDTILDNTEDAYNGAWKVLQDRYGNPFIIQKAFRDKLMKWQRISTNDPLALREFADFLQSCTEAIPHVKGLAILNDCEENHKLLRKLPEWIVRKWSRIVVDELDTSGNYPDLACFTEFLSREARIACKPIASPLVINFKPVDDRSPKRAKAFNTSIQPNSLPKEKQETNNSKPKLPCSVCKSETHGITRCPTFTAKSVEDKRAFIHENRLCFGCLRKGHMIKDCKRRHTCNTCNRRHPTCLHEDRNQRPVETITNSSTSTEEHANQEMHKVLSHASTQRSSATSSIVPVFVSSVQEPHREILTYAILDTQSDSSFVLEDVLDKLNVDVQSVKLKLSTMTAIDTIISSKSVHDLQVRGLYSKICIQLQQAYSRDFIPVDKSYIPTKETASLWPHLRNLADKLPPLQDCDVGLLIGYDCPSALAPLEVVLVEEAKKLITEAQELCKIGGLRLHKFNSNEEAALSCLSPSERAANIEPLGFDPTPSESALGIQWLIKDDTFSFNISLKDQPSTRRGCLSVIASLYDPLGFIAPFSLSRKRILQELCHRGIEWDDPLPEDVKPRWEEWIKGLLKLKEVSIPRCYHPHDFHNIDRVELHHFSDASCIGYGACSYLRYKNDKDEVHCSLVMAKASVAPSKVTSIPRLELAAAVVSAKASVVLKGELDMKIDQEFFWTDSQVVLGYINNDARRFHIFVANLVQLIRDNSDRNQWHYVDTSENPADHASRGLRASDIHSTNWLRGPKFLWERELQITPRSPADLLVGDPEVKTIQVLATETNNCNDILKRLSRFSSWTTLVKVVARIKRLGSKQKQHSEHVTVEERKKAAETVIRIVQQQAFPQEIKMLQGKRELPNSSSLFNLNPVWSEGLLCVGGRLKQSSLCHKVKHPVILPNNSPATKLIVSHYHAKTCHQGRNQTQMELRANGFWVIGGSKLVSKLIRTCVLCRKLRRPTENQQMAELPRERLEASAPFTYSGMDCFGPFIVKKARKESKRYGLIFTCRYSRAVHIEMLEDLSTDSFINALRCFISLRGAVRQLRCDQGSNFIGARNEFKEALKQCDTKLLEIFLIERQCEFVFNSPSASHAGGVWERQIRTIRNMLNAVFAQCPGRLDDASLRTLFYEVMAIVNSRPLTVDGINDPQAMEPLTPNHLITMKSKVALPPPGVFVKEDLYATKRWRRVQYLIEQFWGRWKREYLLNISTRQKWHLPQRNLKVDDIVIIKDDNLPRNHWQLGRVVETVQESDGLVRRVKVQVGERKPHRKQDPHSKPSVIERPIQKLVLLLEN
ncbi:hypothetical protein MHYP_G00203820 [Metynnis hypsauchen]